MSLVEGLASLLREMTLGELALALAAILAYSLAINGSYGDNLRSGAASVAFAASVGFTTLSPGWMSAIVFLALAVVGVAGVAAAAWMLSSVLGLGEAFRTGQSELADAGTDVMSGAPSSHQPAHAFAPRTSAMPL